MVLALHFSAAATDWFPFNTVNHKWNISVNGGYSPSGRVAVYGLGATVRGFHLTIGGFGSTHENDPRLDTWNEDASFMFQFGYQIPVIKSLPSFQLSESPEWGKCRQMDMIGSYHTMHSEI